MFKCQYGVTMGVLAFVVFVAMGGTQSADQEYENAIANYMTPQSYSSALNDEDLYQWTTLSVELTGDIPLWKKLSLAPYLLESLLNDAVYPSDAADQLSGKHHLASVTGRAAFMLERLYDFDLPSTPRNITASDRQHIHGVAIAQYTSYRKGAMDVVDEYEIGFDAGMLQQKYAGEFSKKYPEQADYQLGISLHGPFVTLLEDMMPVGKNMDVLERVLGRSANNILSSAHDGPGPRDCIYEYRFDGGLIGYYYYIRVQEGVIVQINPLS
jgi:hypothetical protein